MRESWVRLAVESTVRPTKVVVVGRVARMLLQAAARLMKKNEGSGLWNAQESQKVDKKGQDSGEARGQAAVKKE